MKKVFLTAILVSGLSVGLFANEGGNKKSEKNAAAYISTTVLDRFSYDFKNAKNVTWLADGNCQKAEFINNGTKMTAFYSLSGTYLGVTRNISYDKIPARAKKEIAKTYKDYQIGEVIELKPSLDAPSPVDYFNSNFNEEKVYFVDLKSDKEELLIKVTPDADVYFFKQVK